MVRGSACSTSANSLRSPPVIHEERREEVPQNDNASTLRPAAEVYPAFKIAEYDTDASSTHSSMPALTESDAASSPEHSMLITPNIVRSCSPSSRDLPYYDDSDIQHLPGPVMMNPLAPNSTTFSETERFSDPKAAESRPKVSQPGRPVTPRRTMNRDNLAPVMNTPTPSADMSGDEKTPLAHCQMQVPTGLKTRHDPTTEPSVHTSSSASNVPNVHNTAPCLGGAGPKTDRAVAGAELPTESFLYCRAREDFLLDDELVFDAAVAVAECDSSETLRPSIFMKQRSIDEVAGLCSDDFDQTQSKTHTSRNEISTSEASDAPEQMTRSPGSAVSGSLGVAKTRVATEEEPANISRADPDKAVGFMEDEMCRTKPDFFEEDEDSAIDSGISEVWTPGGDTIYPAAESWLIGMSERSDIAGQVIPFSDSGIDSGSDFDEKHVLSPIDETAFESDVVEAPLQEGGEPAKPEQETSSGPLGIEYVRRGEGNDRAIISEPVSTAFQAPEGLQYDSEPVEQISIPAPTPASGSPSPPKTRLSVPNHRASRSVSNPQPSPTRLGLGSNHLLPSLPIFSSFTASNLTTATRDSWVSSSSWEDCDSVGRQSNDSVDTIQPTPLSPEDDDLDSSKRLGTPTAGLLGLHESRWAELGLRTALTGTHAFDRPSTAPPRESPERSRDGVRIQHQPEHHDKSTSEKPADSSAPRKAFHIRHKTSIGSIFAGRLVKKESKDLKKQESKELRQKESKELRKKESKDLKKQDKVLRAKAKSNAEEPSATHDDGRFPRAMMLVAGLAFASSVVSRNTA